ncbi:GumC family protein [Mucisphaera sp.]|uniref:GumC family protein n=1 Tax=Mucisphaera sp. TaxID=2913024 RepID=UPI003D0994B1
MSQGDPSLMLPVPSGPAAVEPEGVSNQVSPLRRVHHLLQGRYLYASLLALVLGGLAGAAGYYSMEDRYRATALIEAQSNIPLVVFQLEEHQQMPQFNQWVARQARLIEDERVLRKAAENDAVQRFVLTAEQLGSGTGPLRGGLRVSHDGRTNLISVSFEHLSPDAAEIAAQAITEAYMEIYGQRDIDEKNQVISRVEEIRANLMSQLDRKKQEISLIANEFGSDALMTMYESRLEDLQRHESDLRETEGELARRGIDPTLPLEGQLEQIGTTEVDSDITAEQLAMQDPYMRQLLQRRTQLRSDARVSATEYGRNHDRTKQIVRRFEANEFEIEEFLEMRRNQGARVPSSDASARLIVRGGGDLTLMNEYELVSIYESQKQMRDRLHDETLTLGQQRLRIDELKEDVANLRGQLDQVEERLRRLTTEAGRGDISGRLEVASNAFALPQPVNSGRRKQLAVAGLGAGVAMGFGVFLLIGLMDPRVRSTDEATSRLGSAKLLGVLPTLPDDLGDPQNAAMVGYSVHHMRTLLQLGHRTASTPAYAITGPASGSGKTSLTIALGMSFAATGARTLLIDSDLAGGGLSYRLEAVVRRRIGRILVDAGEISNQELQQALAAASANGCRLGESLINLGLLEPSRLSEILEHQTTTHVGLLDAINGEPVQSCITATDIPNLWVLPIGGALLDDMGRISPTAVRRVIEEAREHYDTVLIDTGPVPGSVETSMVAAEADQVLMIVARGDERHRVAGAVGFLESLGAHLAGFVFNRAEAGDLARSQLSSLLSSRSAGFSRDPRTGEPVTPGDATNFGAVARALIASQGYVSEEANRGPVDVDPVVKSEGQG